MVLAILTAASASAQDLNAQDLNAQDLKLNASVESSSVCVSQGFSLRGGKYEGEVVTPALRLRFRLHIKNESSDVVALESWQMQGSYDIAADKDKLKKKELEAESIADWFDWPEHAEHAIDRTLKPGEVLEIKENAALSIMFEVDQRRTLAVGTHVLQFPVGFVLTPEAAKRHHGQKWIFANTAPLTFEVPRDWKLRAKALTDKGKPSGFSWMCEGDEANTKVKTK